jgi:hypothetical protein
VVWHPAVQAEAAEPTMARFRWISSHSRRRGIRSRRNQRRRSSNRRCLRGEVLHRLGREGPEGFRDQYVPLSPSTPMIA